MLQTSSISVIVVGEANHLESRLTDIAQDHEITIVLESCKDLLSAKVALADILLFDGIPTGYSTLNGSSFPRSLARILFADLTNCNDLEIEGLFTGVWPQPCSDALLSLWYRQLIDSVCCQKKFEISQIYLNTLINSVPDLIWFKDLRGSHLKVNKAFGHAVGKTIEQCEGRGHYYIWDLEPDEYASGEYVCLETEEEVIRKKETCLFDEKVLSKNGLRQFKTYKSPLMNKWGDMFGTVGIAKDVTDLQNISRELSLVLSSIPLATLISDADEHTVYFNENFCEYFGVTGQQIEEMTYTSVCHELLGLSPEDLDSKDMTEISLSTNGVKRTFHVQQQTLKDIFGNHFGNFLLAMDVSREYDLKQKIIQSANTDFLTGLHSRRYFYQRIADIPVDTQLSLIYFDLDNFKLVNDRYGHHAGDRALILMADELRAAFGSQIITRMGGDEFIVVFFDGVNIEQIVTQVDEFIKILTNSFHSKTDADYKFISVSAGISFGKLSDPGLDALILYADEALYDAKAKGKGRYSIYSSPSVE